MIPRRALLAGIPALATAPWAGPPPLGMITIYLDGGWDTTLLLDPLPLTAEQTDAGEQVATYDRLVLATNPTLRPLTSAFFDTWASRATAIRGAWVGSIGHTACRTRVLHGLPDATTPDLPTRIGAGLQGSAALGTIDLSGQLEPGHWAPTTARLGRQQQVRGLIDPAFGPVPPAGSDRPWPPWTPSVDAEAAARAVLEARMSRRRLSHPSTALDDLGVARSAADAWVAAAASEVANWPDALLTLEEAVDLAPSLLATRQCASVLLTLQGWDTHASVVAQHSLYDRLFAALDVLLLDLQALGRLDQTLVLVVSEMTRNPTMNALGGKDHWPMTSALLLGGPLPGGRTLGGTDDALGPVPIRLDTGEIGGDTHLLAENLVAGLLVALGVDPGPELAGVTPFTALAS